jgi:hypothetical protein
MLHRFQLVGAGRIAVILAVAAVVCLAQQPQPLPPSLAEKAAKVVQMTGQVSVLRDDNPWALRPGDSVQVRQVIVTGADGFAIFEVSDGSTFEVFPNSRVVFRNNPSNLRDLLDLFIGRVKVHIQKLGGQPNPNRVQTPTAIISVRGTVFDVVIEDEDATTLVYVEEGQVAVRHALFASSDSKLLNAGEYVRIFKTQPLAQKSADKGAAVQRGLHSLADALYTILYRTQRAGGSPVPGGGGGRPLPGDNGGSGGGGTGGGTPAPPPPPPPGGGGGVPPPPPD